MVCLEPHLHSVIVSPGSLFNKERSKSPGALHYRGVVSMVEAGSTGHHRAYVRTVKPGVVVVK